MNRSRIFSAVMVVGVAAFVTVLATGPALKRGPEGLKPLSTSGAQLIDSGNRKVDFSEFKGKVVFINNWASWCPPCIAEMPSIQVLKNKLKGEEVVFVMVSFDQDPGKAKSFVRKRNFDFGIYFPGDAYPYPTAAIPATFILDKQGKVFRRFTGSADYSSDRLADELKKLANE